MAQINSLKYFLFILVFSSVNIFSQTAKDKIEIKKNINYEERLKFGIEKSDIDIVKEALENLKLDKKTKKHFLFLANERVSFRKDMLRLALLGKTSGEGKPRKDNKDFYAFLALLASTGTLFYSLSKESMTGLILSSVGIIISGAALEVNTQNEYKDIYQDAIEIRELIIKA